ncbi:unnamed protein product [Rhizophagus irregularis]|uniref:ATPase dynein-related AAA domain-containing protein n=1 Tax=Rhizophagus irregularis TaxID=588596 RepID=A0A915ZPH2_9GLOM|nr:unnamed protein product [Rhizophagus irregularis]
MFAKIIREEQEDYISRMRCPPNVVKNEALLENVLTTIVCILTRIPVFIIGEAGTSKSLAIRLIISNLRGSDSKDEYFKSLPQIYLIPLQGSPFLTSDSIVKALDKANRYQEISTKQFPVISAVLLENVELAEANSINPLKVLHSLLEPNFPAIGPTVSIIGISNRCLDVSKSSRALLVQRPIFDLDDLSDYSYSVMRKIMMYVEEGKLLILTDLEVIYGNLYNLWDQNCNATGNFGFVTRVTLGTYTTPMLHVSPSFKCIIVMNENNLASADPSLLNRFEKQRMSVNDILNDRQKLLVDYLNNWRE